MEREVVFAWLHPNRSASETEIVKISNRLAKFSYENVFCFEESVRLCFFFNVGELNAINLGVFQMVHVSTDPCF